MSVAIGEMSEEKLRAHLRAQQLVDYTAGEVVDGLNIGDEITVQSRVMF